MVMSLPRWLLLSSKSSFVNCSCIVADSIAVLAGVSQANNATPKFDMGPFQKKSLKKLESECIVSRSCFSVLYP